MDKTWLPIHVTEDYRIERGWRDVDWPAGSPWGSREWNGARIYNREVCERDKKQFGTEGTRKSTKGGKTIRRKSIVQQDIEGMQRTSKQI